MAKDASQYPVTENFGCQPGYPLNQNLCPPGQGFHNGIDYGCPTGTPIVVNGVTIGLSGATGYVTGPHLHVGRWVNGKATNPGVGKGFTFKSAKVTEINQDATNGKYVRVQGDGASWVYLHLSKIGNIKVGQVLTPPKENDVAVKIDLPTARYLVAAFYGFDGKDGRINAFEGEWDKNLQGLIGKELNHNQIVALFRNPNAVKFRDSK